MHNLINVNGQEYRQLQRRTAKKLFDEGNTIYLIPCNMNPSSPWCGLVSINDSELVEYQRQYGSDLPSYLQDLFNKRVNEFIYYNCNIGLGTYPHYFILNN